MMRSGTMTEAEAIEMVGKEAVEAVLNKNCDFSNRRMDGGVVEFTASFECEDKDGDPATLIAYYYQTEEDVDSCEQLDELDWEVEGFEVY